MDVSKFQGIITNDEEINPVNKKLICEYLKHKASDPRIKQDGALYFHFQELKRAEEWYNHKPFNELTNKDYKELILRFKKAKPRTKKVKNYKSGVKKVLGKPMSDGVIRRTLSTHKAFLKWLWRYDYNTEKQASSFDKEFKEGYIWVVDNQDLEEPIIFTLEERTKVLSTFDEIIKNSRDHKQFNLWVISKCVFGLCWDAGLRPQELFNLKREHITWDEHKNNYWLFVNHPKKGSQRRKIDLPYSTEVINEYLSQFEIKSNELFFKPLSVKPSHYYRAIEYKVKRVLKKVGIDKKFNLYSLRHSSIQHYLELYQANYQALAKRYGWSFASVQARLHGYLARSQVNLPDSNHLRREDEIKKMKDQLLKDKDEELNEMRVEMQLNQQKLKEQFDFLKWYMINALEKINKHMPTDQELIKISKMERLYNEQGGGK